MALTVTRRIVTYSRYTYSLHDVTVTAMKKRSHVDVRECFGFAVKLRREGMKLTQEELADKAGIHRTYLSDIERGTRNVSLINIERLAIALSVPMSELFRLVEKQ
jgi:DNA-binding XRE family transcriptional regulator